MIAATFALPLERRRFAAAMQGDPPPLRARRHDVEDRSLSRHDLLASPLPRHSNQRLEVIGGRAGPRREIGQDRRFTSTPVEMRLRSFEPHTLFVALEQLAQARYVGQFGVSEPGRGTVSNLITGAQRMRSCSSGSSSIGRSVVPVLDIGNIHTGGL